MTCSMADTFIADIDEAKNHYDVRAEYSRLLGHGFGQRVDTRTIAAASSLLAARSAVQQYQEGMVVLLLQYLQTLKPAAHADLAACYL